MSRLLSRSAAMAGLAALLVGLQTSPVAAMCDVIPQPETVFRGETGSLNRVYASPGDPLRISIDTAAGSCEAGSGGFQTGDPGTTLTDFDSYSLEGWTQDGSHTSFFVSSWLAGPALIGEIFFADQQGARAPAAFLGDWTTRGVTQINWVWAGDDDATMGASDAALRISGPGGSAEWRPNLGFLSDLQAVNLSADVDTSAPTGDWVVTGGTWAGLMSQVDELIVVGDLGFPFFFSNFRYSLDDIHLVATGQDGSVATLLFEPPAGATNAVVIPNGVSCASLATELAACTAALGGGTVTCRDDIVPTLTAESLQFPMPDEGYAGPVTVAVSAPGAALPCGLATAECAAPGAPTGLLACIDSIYASDGTCAAEEANLHAQFPGLTALPVRNDFENVCDSANPSIPCSNSGADVLLTTDAAGNLVIPIDWRGVLVPGTLPIPRLVRATSNTPAFVGPPPEPAQTQDDPIEVPGRAFLQSFSAKGLRVDPLFNPLFSEDSADTELFGSVDAEFGVVRVLRRSPVFRQCEAGDRAALPCIADFECPGSSCGAAACRAGAQDGSPCASDAQCPGGECGAGLYDLSDRYSSGGTGPIVMTSADYDAEALNPAAIDGLAATDDLFMFVRSEPLEAEDLNLDGDQTDSTIVTLRASADGQDAGLGAVPGAVGRAGVRARSFPFRFPAVAVEDDIIALLEAEPEEGGADSNGDGDVFDTILRVFRLDSSPATELTLGLDLAVDADERIDRSSVAVSDGLVFFRRDETAAADRTTTDTPWFGGPLRISPDGRFVLFEALDGTIVPGDTNGASDLFVFDRDPDGNGILDEPGTTIARVSVATNGAQGTCGACASFTVGIDLTPDGRFVTHSTTLALDPADTNNGEDVYVYDRDADQDGIFDEPGAITTIRISDGDGTAVGFPQISASGRYVTYYSFSDFLPGDVNGIPDIYALDRDSDEDGIFDEPGATVHVPLVETGTGWPFGMSEDGRFVTFEAGQLQALVPEDTNGREDIYLIDRDVDEDGVLDEPGETAFRLVSATANGEVSDIGATGFSHLNADGRYVFFQSSSGNLVPGGSTTSVYVRDRDADEDGIFDELGGVDLRSTSLFGSFHSSPEGRWLVGLQPGNGGSNFATVDQETSLSHALAPSGNNPGWPSDIGSRGAFVVHSEEVTGNVRTAGIDTSDLAEDLNADGDLLDVSLAVADARLAAPIPVINLGPADLVAVDSGNAAFLRPESADGAGADLNGDLDVDDRVVHLYRNRVPPAVNLGLAAEKIAVSAQVIAVLASEAGEGALLNGDGDMDDRVVHVTDVATGTSGSWTNLSIAADDVQAAGAYVAFTVPESDQGASLNGDGDQADRVLRVYDFQAGSFVAFQDELGTPIPGLAVDDFILTDGVIAFRVNEFDQGQNLNGVVPPIPGGVADADLLDSVIHVADLATGTVYNGFQAAIPCPVEACDPRVPYRLVGAKATFLTLEAQQGGNDLDQSGDGGTGLVLQHFNPDALAAGGSMLDACDVVSGALGGICTNTAEACASNNDCAGDACYFPPGGCLFDTLTGCIPENPVACTGDEFCAPLLGMPGQGTCQEFQGPCLDDGQCGGGAFCTDNGVDPEQLFAAVGDEPDGRQRFVSEGRCTDGDGSCRNDGDCNEGAMCDGAVTVIATAADPDTDGLADPIDNCDDVPNGDQLDLDQDGVGDACDRATCGNGVQEYGEECDAATDCDASCLYTGVGDACSDGVDNDGDGLIDSPSDPGCTDPLDSSERDAGLPCDDGVDNDGDFASDHPADIGCGSASGATESPECDDGIDNDGDGFIDFPTDPECTGGDDVMELPEPAMLLQLAAGLAMLQLLARRRARRT